MKHTQNLFKGFYMSKHGNEFKVIVDKYSGNDYRVVKVFNDQLTPIIGKSLQSGHRFRRAKKAELPLFEEC